MEKNAAHVSGIVPNQRKCFKAKNELNENLLILPKKKRRRRRRLRDDLISV